jgi:hypothetical protein
MSDSAMDTGLRMTKVFQDTAAKASEEKLIQVYEKVLPEIYRDCFKRKHLFTKVDVVVDSAIGQSTYMDGVTVILSQVTKELSGKTRTNCTLTHRGELLYQEMQVLNSEYK